MDSQVRIAEADNTAQNWPNLGIQQSAIVIGPVSSFASVKCWTDDGDLCRLFKFTDLQPKLAQYRPYTKPIVTITMASSIVSGRSRVQPMDGTLLGLVSLLPRQTNLKWEKQSSAQHRPDAVPKKNVGVKSLGQNWPPSAYQSYHSKNGTILATDLRQHFYRCWASVRPYLTSYLGYHWFWQFFIIHITKSYYPFLSITGSFIL